MEMAGGTKVDDRRIVCVKCGAVNRLPAQRNAAAAKCGGCGVRLFDGHPQEVDGSMLDRMVTRGTVPVLVDFWAPWCGPCRSMAPAFEAAARELEPGVRLAKLNSDQHQAAASAYGIRGIPTLILFDRGREAARVSGAMSTSGIVGWVHGHLPSRRSS